MTNFDAYICLSVILYSFILSVKKEVALLYLYILAVFIRIFAER